MQAPWSPAMLAGQRRNYVRKLNELDRFHSWLYLLFGTVGVLDFLGESKEHG